MCPYGRIAEEVNVGAGVNGLTYRLLGFIWVIPGETNMKNGRPLQISPIIGTCAGSVRISYQYKYLRLVLYGF